MITANILRRTFHIKFGNQTGTAFTIDIDNKQYLVTARHVCGAIRDGDKIDIYRNDGWIEFSVKVVGLGDEKKIENDVAVLALEKQLSPSHTLLASSKNLVWGQNVYFLGFPFGLHTVMKVNDGYPIPLIKGAVMSGSAGNNHPMEAFLLDGHNNPGFSGGPVVFRPGEIAGADLQVAAIVSAYRTEHVDVKFQGKPTGLTSAANTGIVVCPSIKQVTDLIAANSIGAKVVF